jgi:hypothetical protein
MNTYLAIMHMHIQMNLDNWTTLVCTAIIEGQAKSIFLTWKQCAKRIPNPNTWREMGTNALPNYFLIKQIGGGREGGRGEGKHSNFNIVLQ